MGKVEIGEYQKAIRSEFEAVKTVELLGGTERRNSYTFKVTFSDKPSVVMKLLKKTSGAEKHINDEKESLKRIQKNDSIRVSRLLRSGEIKVARTRYPYLMFPFYDGETIQRTSQYAESVVKEFIFDACETILELAKAGIIHQDIKPDNIIKLANGSYVILDLGIARFTRLEPSFVKQQGPAAYLSFEQVQLGSNRNMTNQRRITFLSDFQSVAIVALNMLLGKSFPHAWEIDRRAEAADRIRRNEIIAIQDSDLKELIACLLEANPSSRMVKLSKWFDLSHFQSVAPYNSRYWSLHKQTGLSFLKSFLTDNPHAKMGLVLSADAIQSTSSTQKMIEPMRDAEWDITIDPATHKLLYEQEHHGHLKDKTYYQDDLTKESFYDSDLKKRFARQVIEFERSVDPTFYISPYFFLRSGTDEHLTIGLSLYEESKRSLELLGDSRPLALGLSLSNDLLKRPDDLLVIADQLVLRDDIDIIYLNLELLKHDNTPCKDEEYLSGVNTFVSKLSSTKNVIVAQVDQACLGLVMQPRVSLAVNPDISYRKNDIEEKLSNEKDDNRGGPKSEHKRYRVYVPKMMTDLDISRDLQNPAFATLNRTQKVITASQSPYYNDASNIGDAEARKKHFTYEFDRQVSEISSNPSVAKDKFGAMLDGASEIYVEVTKAGIKLDADQTGDFIKSWGRVFLNRK